MLEREPPSPIGIGVRQLLLASTVPRESAPPPSRTSNLRRTEGVSRAFVYHTQQGPRGSKRHGESQGSSHAGTSTGFARRGNTQTRAARRGTCLTGLFDPLMRHACRLDLVMQTDGEGCPRSPGPGPWELVVAAVRYLAPFPFLFNE